MALHQDGHDDGGSTKKCCGKRIDATTKERISWASLIIGAVVSAILLVMSALAYVQVNGFINDYENVVDSWQTPPITRISVAPSCTGGSVALTATWPGLYDACDCSYRHSGTNSTDSDTSSCSYNQLNDGCLNRWSEFPPVSVSYFGSSQKICIHRSGPTTVQRAAFDLDSGTCPAGHHVCGQKLGGGTIDNRICWPDTEPNCPVTDIGFSQTDLSLAQSGADGKQSQAARDITGNWVHLYWKNGGVLNQTYFGIGTQRSTGSQPLAGLPLVEIQFQPNDPCTLAGCGYSGVRSVDARQSLLFKQRYPREGFMIRGRCSGGCTSPKSSSSISPSGRDIRYIQISHIKEIDLFAQYPRDIPEEFRTSQNDWMWFVSVKTETQWSPQCPRHRTDVIDHTSSITNVRTAQMTLLIFSILSFIVLAVYFPCMKCLRPDKYRSFEKCNCCLKVFFKLVALICTIITVVLALGLLGFWSDLASNSSSGNSMVCSDPLTAETFDTLFDIFSGLSMKGRVNTAATVSDSALHIFENWIHRCF